MKERIAVSFIGIMALVGFFYIGDVAAEAGHKPGTMGHMKGMKARMEEMEKDAQSHHQTMMTRMDSLDEQLQQKVAAMQKARGDKKVEAMQAVIEELVGQRQTMQHQMMEMMPQMMGHMAQHMGMMEGMEGMGEMMKMCPMMQGMHGEKEKVAEEDHSAHH